MDEEVAMIRDLLAVTADPPRHVVHGAWETLDQRMRGTPAQAGPVPGRPVPRHGAVRWPRRWLSRPLLLGGVATGAATALAVGVLAAAHPGPVARRPSASGPGAPRPPASRPVYVVTEERPLGNATGQPAQPVLLSIAVRLAHAPAASGRYWCNVNVNAMISPIGPDATELTPPGQGQSASPVSDYRYTIAQRYRSETCWQQGQIGMVGASNQALGARPATRAANRRRRRRSSSNCTCCCSPR